MKRKWGELSQLLNRLDEQLSELSELVDRVGEELIGRLPLETFSTDTLLRLYNRLSDEQCLALRLIQDVAREHVTRSSAKPRRRSG
jgi:hypothetical protein